MTVIKKQARTQQIQDLIRNSAEKYLVISLHIFDIIAFFVKYSSATYFV